MVKNDLSNYFYSGCHFGDHPHLEESKKFFRKSFGTEKFHRHLTLVNFLLDRQVGSILNLISSVNNLDNADFVQRLKGNREGGPWQIELHDQDCNHKNILHFLWFSFLPKHTKKITLPDIGSCFTWPSWGGEKEGGITKDTQVFVTLLSFYHALWQQYFSI